MTRSFSSVAKWVLCIVLIALFIATFACCFLFSSGTSVASALTVFLPDDYTVGANLLGDTNTSGTSLLQNSAFGIAASASHTSVSYGSFSALRLTSTNLGAKVSGSFYNDEFSSTVYTMTIYILALQNCTFDIGDQSISSVGVTSVTFNYQVSSSINKIYYFVNASSTDNYIDIAFIKLEFGSSSTGYEFDYTELYNAGYDVGYDEGFSAGKQDGYTDGYNQGKADGYDQGKADGYDQGKADGYDQGKTDGYNQGKQDGYTDGYNQGQSDGYEQGYQEGYSIGYDDGYEQGTADGVISANDIFLCTFFELGSNGASSSVFIKKGDADSSTTNIMINSLPMVFLPLSCLYYDEYNGGFYPKDIVRDSQGQLPSVNDSSYWISFDSLTECGQWLLDNPNDFLCTYYFTQEEVPEAAVFSDLTKLPNFMSGSGESYQVGYNDGYDNGQYDGQQTGYNQGYNAGYSKGAASASDYTFLGLIGAVFDAPIEAFRGLLDFEILGVNMSSFVMAMFSLCIVFLFLKLVLR